MKEVVVYVDPAAGMPGAACRIESPFDVPDVVSFLTVDDLTQLVPPGVVRQLGEGLSDRIRQNPTVQQVLDLVLAHPPGQVSLPILFRVGDPLAHSLSWEALVAGNDFLALGERWPIARIARGSTLDRDPVRPFVPPLRLMCVLSAVGQDAAEEWTGIHAAVTAARAAGLPVQVTLVSGDEAGVLEPARALGDPDLTVVALPNPAADVPVLALVENSQPHILHVFGHGAIANDIGMVELGTIGDFERADGTSSVLVRAEELGLAARRTGAWCVVLNICRGAEAGSAALTHAEEVVAHGVPAAVGMRRQVDVDDANAFSREWYPGVLAAVQRVVAAGAGQHELAWSDTLVAARRRLRDLHGGNPGDDDTWTLPVLYKLPGPFRLELPPAGVGENQERTRLSEGDTLGGLIDVLPAGADASIAAELRGLVP
ncbi:CHAT domain-containing protein [Oryzobacter telluris]|uniref:CHAT domain-containing protein n=1 Tax=Oryzobacter telluris TaxID=3149179 RepID=UPI00370DE2EF